MRVSSMTRYLDTLDMEALLGLREDSILERHAYPANHHGITWENTKTGVGLNDCMHRIATTFEDNPNGERLRTAHTDNNPLVIVTNDRTSAEAGYHWFVVRCSWRRVAQRYQTRVLGHRCTADRNTMVDVEHRMAAATREFNKGIHLWTHPRLRIKAKLCARNMGKS